MEGFRLAKKYPHHVRSSQPRHADAIAVSAVKQQQFDTAVLLLPANGIGLEEAEIEYDYLETADDAGGMDAYVVESEE